MAFGSDGKVTNSSGPVVHPRHMVTMALTPDEMSNVASQLPLDVVQSHMMHYDPGTETLHYGLEIADQVEAADRKVARKRVPKSITLLQAYLELVARDVKLVPQSGEQEVLWRFATTLERSDSRVSEALEASGVTDVDDFFISAARRK